MASGDDDDDEEEEEGPGSPSPSSLPPRTPVATKALASCSELFLPSLNERQAL